MDSDKLDGIDSSGFLGATAKAADSDELDGIDSTGFATASQVAGTVKNVYTVTSPNTAAGPGQTIVEARCLKGDVVLGGGNRVDPTTGNFDVFILSELPRNVEVDFGPPIVLTKAWSLNIINRETNPLNEAHVSAIAICGDVN